MISSIRCPEGSIPGHGYHMKWGLTPDEFAATARLRKRVFCDELGWVRESDGTHEVDQFDEETITIAVFSNNSAVASLRIHPPSTPWMAYTVFRDIWPIPPSAAESPATCEVSRLALAPEYRRRRLKDGTWPAEALYRTLFAFCAVNDLRYVHMVVSVPVLRSLRRSGLPCQRLGFGRIMEDGVHAVPASLDWHHFMKEGQLRDPARLQRFTNTLAGLKSARGNGQSTIQIKPVLNALLTA